MAEAKVVLAADLKSGSITNSTSGPQTRSSSLREILSVSERFVTDDASPDPKNKKKKTSKKTIATGDDFAETPSQSGSFSMNCSTIGLSGIESRRSLLKDPDLLNFIMDRFLPAAQALVAGSPFSAHKPWNPVAKPTTNLSHGENRYPVVRGCGLVPKFCVATSFCFAMNGRGQAAKNNNEEDDDDDCFKIGRRIGRRAATLGEILRGAESESEPDFSEKEDGLAARERSKSIKIEEEDDDDDDRRRIPLPPPLPKSPTDSWLFRTLPTFASSKPSSASPGDGPSVDR